jgi:hypothetical protein
MKPAHADLHARIDRLCERARSGADARLAGEMNDLLSEGYARALLDESRIVALDERVVDALMTPADGRGEAFEMLVAERRAAARAVECLRRRLDAMHEQYLALDAR